MAQPQLELWSAEPHPTPTIYLHLTPEQRTVLVNQLAYLMLKIIQDPATYSSSSTESTNHEREPKDR